MADHNAVRKNVSATTHPGALQEEFRYIMYKSRSLERKNKILTGKLGVGCVAAGEFKNTLEMDTISIYPMYVVPAVPTLHCPLLPYTVLYYNQRSINWCTDYSMDNIITYYSVYAQ